MKKPNRSHFKKILAFFCFLFALNNIEAQQTYWQQQVNYIIDVTLYDKDHSLDAFEKLEYINNSPDTLFFIWFHIWPNAYKNDRTAFSDQLLINGRTDFYFSGKEKRGYINRLDFKVDGITAKMEDHPEYIDVIKIVLPKPVAPSQTIIITTPFHVKLPFNFSRGGHTGQSYQVTQWYPKPAVYDHKGWHPMPYLDQGEFYSEFGNYDVRINLPSNYVVAATGILQNAEEKEWLKQKSSNGILNAANITDQVPAIKKKNTSTRVGPKINTPKRIIDSFSSSSTIKSLRFLQNSIHDFAWFADKKFIVNYDSVKLQSGRVVELFSFYLPPASEGWKKSIEYMKDALKTRSSWVGEYPYDVASVVEAQMGVYGGMEYPTITSVSPIKSEQELDVIIQHELGHNWFYGVLANNERSHPWLDEGINTFYDERYQKLKYDSSPHLITKETFQSKRLPAKFDALGFETVAAMDKDQPINTSAQRFTEYNYGLVGYYKSSQWLKHLEDYLGQAIFDSCMSAYFQKWKFKHVYPEDFKNVFESTSNKNLDSIFLLLDKKGSLHEPVKKSIQLTSFFNLKDTDKKNYISFAPVPGYNNYDGFMVGIAIHNYQLPLNPFQFIAIPMFGTKSKTLNGIGRASYNWYPRNAIQKLEAGISASIFSMNRFDALPGEELNLKFTKLAPFIRVNLKQPLLTQKKSWLQLKWYLLKEDQLDFRTIINGQDTSDVIVVANSSSYITELKYVMENARVLYPYKAELQLQQHKDFLRVHFTGNYFFNYSSNKGGMKLRFFAGKFIYTGNKTSSKQFQTDKYHLNLTGPKGEEDYTYSNYFVGRSRFAKWPSQQIMIRDGGFKVRADLLSDKPGKTDDWLTAINLSATIPDHLNPLQVLPVKLPLKLFFDLGTYAEPWKAKSESGKFLYDAGFQLSFCKETINIYIPVMYSSIYRDYFRSTLGNNRFLKTISFSIDIQDLTLKNINKDLSF